ncbi:MAG TPA: helix-turn-helix domain-containing protein [Candidatus Dojkabacteria bacterium]|nr:helix-turn-helix domain-containing protein [Candidatus Dojkabacteria bacterium]
MLTPGEIFKKRRLQLRKTLSIVSQETKIQEKYIEGLENDDYTSFNSPVFASGFVKIYADYLGLDVDKMSAIYRRSYTQESLKNQPKKDKFNFKDITKKYVNPISIIALIVLIAIIGLLVYFNKQMNQVNNAPKIEVSSPQDNATVNQSSLELKGYTNKDFLVKVNNNDVTNTDGSFTTNLTLKEGSNVITIQSLDPKNSSNKTIKTLTVKYVKQTNTQTPENTTTSYNIYLDILNEPAWIQLVVDDQQKLAQVAPVGKTSTYKITKSFQVITGKPLTTKVYINKVLKALKINSATGVASLSCTIENQQLNCQ